MNDIVEVIKELVKSECKSDKNYLDESIYDFHLRIVEKYCIELCKCFSKANLLVLQIAAYIHDLSAIRNYDLLPVHNKESAKLAKDIFGDKLTSEELQLLEDAIVNHNLPFNNGTIESMILSNADAMSKFECPIYWISYANKRRFTTFKESVNWYGDLIDKVFWMIVPEAKKISEEKYQQAKITTKFYSENVD